MACTPLAGAWATGALSTTGTPWELDSRSRACTSFSDAADSWYLSLPSRLYSQHPDRSPSAPVRWHRFGRLAASRRQPPRPPQRRGPSAAQHDVQARRPAARRLVNARCGHVRQRARQARARRQRQSALGRGPRSVHAWLPRSRRRAAPPGVPVGAPRVFHSATGSAESSSRPKSERRPERRAAAQHVQGLSRTAWTSSLSLTPSWCDMSSRTAERASERALRFRCACPEPELAARAEDVVPLHAQPDRQERQESPVPYLELSHDGLAPSDAGRALSARAVHRLVLIAPRSSLRL